MGRTIIILVAVVIALAVIVKFVGGGNGEGEGKSTLTGKILIDGSSTVFPISEAVAEEFGHVHPRVKAPVGLSGTGGGFKKFYAGETAINDASRPIKQKEIDKCKEKNIEFIEIPVAFDGLSVVVNKGNDFVDHLTVEELHLIFKPGSSVNSWKDVRGSFPDEPIKLFSPGQDSGTFDYFTETVNHKSGACRSEGVTFSEDDNVLVNGVAGEKYGLGFFGFAYYVENKSKLKVVPIKDKGEPVAPTMETINNGTYAPLSRPLFIYVRADAAKRPEVKAFVSFYIKNAPELTKSVGYVPLPQPVYDVCLKRFETGVTGSAVAGISTAGVSLLDLYK